MKRVLVMDANQRSALAVTRSLGRQAVPVITADDTDSALAGSSRYSREYWQYPSPQHEAERFISAIQEVIRDKQIEILLPMTELTTGLLLENRHRLSPAILPFADKGAIDQLSNKCALMQLADELGVPVPRSDYFNVPSEPALAQLTYPLILKPASSWINDGQQWFRSSVRLANSKSEAEQILTTDPGFQHQAFMVQECIPGHGQGVFALYQHGEPVAFFSHRRIREKPPWGGVSVLSESTPPDPELVEYAKRLLKAVQWHGVAMVEFKVSPDGKPYLMEINTRFWGSLQLAIDAGVDFPFLLYKIACDEALSPVSQYRIGQRLRWLLGDLDQLYLSMKSKDLSLLQKLKACLCFLTPSLHRTRFEVNRLTDIRPFWWELKQYLRDVFRC